MAEMQLRDGNGAYDEPGNILYERRDTGTQNDYIEAQLVHNGVNGVYIQLKTNDAGDGFAGGDDTPGSNQILAYEVMGTFSTIT